MTQLNLGHRILPDLHRGAVGADKVPTVRISGEVSNRTRVLVPVVPQLCCSTSTLFTIPHNDSSCGGTRGHEKAPNRIEDNVAA